MALALCGTDNANVREIISSHKDLLMILTISAHGPTHKKHRPARLNMIFCYFLLPLLFLDFPGAVANTPLPKVPTIPAVDPDPTLFPPETPDSELPECTLCFDGSEPHDNLSCDVLESQAIKLVAGSDACRNMQLQGHESCGCPRPPERGYCTVCPDGSPVDTDRYIPVVPGVIYTPCWLFEMTWRNLYPLPCREFVQRNAFWCGCPGVVNECPLCPEADLDKIFPNRLKATCRDAAYSLSLRRYTECTDYYNEYSPRSYCGCEDAEPPNTCSICPEGMQVSDPDQIVPPYEDVTCGFLQDIVPFVHRGYFCNYLTYVASPCACSAPAAPTPDTVADDTTDETPAETAALRGTGGN